MGLGLGVSLRIDTVSLLLPRVRITLGFTIKSYCIESCFVSSVGLMFRVSLRIVTVILLLPRVRVILGFRIRNVFLVERRHR